MTATPTGAVFFLGSVIERSSPLCTTHLSWVKTLTLWSGDGDASGVVSLLGGVVFRKLTLSQSVAAAAYVAVRMVEVVRLVEA
jgi:hypothetical protein